MLPPRKNPGRSPIIRIEGDLAFVSLSKGYEAIVDVADVALVSDRCWHALVRKRTVYARATTSVDGRKCSASMHQVILPVQSGMVVDHINGNGLDNRRINLRGSTHSENSRNNVHRRSGHVPHIRFNKKDGKYECYVYIGSFSDREAAQQASVKAEGKLGYV